MYNVQVHVFFAYNLKELCHHIRPDQINCLFHGSGGSMISTF